MNFRKTVIFLLILAITALPALGVEVTPSNVVWPTISGDTFSFDLAISDADPVGVNDASICKITLSASPSGLVFDAAGSEAVESDTSYWIYGNSGGGAFAEDLGSDTYAFSDGPSIEEDLMSGEILSRYAFTWDGVAKDYTFTLDLDTIKSYVMLDIIFDIREAIEFSPGSYSGNSTSFTVSITPEPATLILLAFGSVMLTRKRRN